MVELILQVGVEQLTEQQKETLVRQLAVLLNVLDSDVKVLKIQAHTDVRYDTYPAHGGTQVSHMSKEPMLGFPHMLSLLQASSALSPAILLAVFLVHILSHPYSSAIFLKENTPV